MPDFSLQDIGVGAGSSVNDMSAPNGTFNWGDALGGLAIGVAASAANVGLQTLAVPRKRLRGRSAAAKLHFVQGFAGNY